MPKQAHALRPMTALMYAWAFSPTASRVNQASVEIPLLGASASEVAHVAANATASSPAT